MTFYYPELLEPMVDPWAVAFPPKRTIPPFSSRVLVVACPSAVHQHVIDRDKNDTVFVLIREPTHFRFSNPFCEVVAMLLDAMWFGLMDQADWIEIQVKLDLACLTLQGGGIHLPPVRKDHLLDYFKTVLHFDLDKRERDRALELKHARDVYDEWNGVRDISD